MESRPFDTAVMVSGIVADFDKQPYPRYPKEQLMRSCARCCWGVVDLDLTKRGHPLLYTYEKRGCPRVGELWTNKTLPDTLPDSQRSEHGIVALKTSPHPAASSSQKQRRLQPTFRNHSSPVIERSVALAN